jgi:hypothetical protein
MVGWMASFVVVAWAEMRVCVKAVEKADRLAAEKAD